MIKTKSRIASILFWSVISAAFIGPGTLATASAAGASFGFALIWALVFATISCVVLQEMAARISIISGKDLGKIMMTNKINKGGVLFVAFSVILGCAAYQAGNILGAIAGLELITEFQPQTLTLLVGVIAGALLWFGSIKQIASSLGVLVAVMGILFFIVALRVKSPAADLLSGALVPTIPIGSEWLILGLVGTTIVPYNLFLGSGIGQGQEINSMRFGLITSIALGGIVSIAILVVGTNISEKASFQNLALVIGQNLGDWAKIMMAIGLFAAGLTSSITSPLAGAIIGKSVFDHQNKWNYKSNGYRFFWMAVLITGLIFGLVNIKPLPVIIAAQALNGLILPIIAIVIIINANNISLLSKTYVNHVGLNVLSLIILNLVSLIGLNNLIKAIFSTLDINTLEGTERFFVLQALTLPFIIYTLLRIRRVRSPKAG